MNKFLIALAVAAIAGATYVAAAPGGQTAGPTAQQFRALETKVAKLQRTVRSERRLLAACMKFSIPIARFGDYNNEPPGFGYTFTDPNVNGGTPFYATALDKTLTSDPNALWITGGAYACHQHLPGALHKPRARSR